jgi:hypothetical protein
MGAGLTEIGLVLASFRSKFSLYFCSWDAERLVAGIIPLELLYERCPTPNQRATSSRSDRFLRKVNAQHGRSQPSIFFGGSLHFEGGCPGEYRRFALGDYSEVHAGVTRGHNKNCRSPRMTPQVGVLAWGSGLQSLLRVLALKFLWQDSRSLQAGVDGRRSLGFTTSYLGNLSFYIS